MRDCMVTLTFTGPEGTILDLNLKTIQIICQLTDSLHCILSYLLSSPNHTHAHNTHTNPWNKNYSQDVAVNKGSVPCHPVDEVVKVSRLECTHGIAFLGESVQYNLC